MSAPQGEWWIVCDDHRVGPIKSQGAAERRLAEVERMGVCKCPHHVEQTA